MVVSIVGVIVALGIFAGIGIGGYTWWQSTKARERAGADGGLVLSPAAGPTSSMAPSSIVSPAPNPGQVDFSAWQAFGGIDVRVSDGGRSVLLDTHDTVQTWTTKWSGLIGSGTPSCAVSITGRVRDVSHSAGASGGFGIGLASLNQGGSELTGTAVQFDYGFQGYRTNAFPSDTATVVQPAALDNSWHDVAVSVGSNGTTSLTVDGVSAATAQGNSACGQPVIRVWGGAAEFSNFSVTPG